MGSGLGLGLRLGLGLGLGLRIVRAATGPPTACVAPRPRRSLPVALGIG